MEKAPVTVSVIMIVFLGALTAITPLSTDMYLPALPFLPDEFQTTTSTIQLTLTTTMIGIAIGQIIGGPLSDAYGRKNPLIIGNLLCLLASIVCGMSNSIELLLIARFMQGLTGSIGIVVAKAIARDYASGQTLTKLLALLMMVNGLAPVIAPLIGGQLLNYFSWRMAFYVIAFFCAIMLIGSIIFKDSLPKEKRIIGGLPKAIESFKILLQDKGFVGQCLIQWFAFGAFFAYISGSAFVYQNVFHLSAQTFSYVFGINSFSIIVTGAISGRLSNTVSNYHMLSFSLWQFAIASLLVLICLMLDAPFILTTILILLAVCTISVWGSASFSMALRKHGKIAGAASALIGFFSMAAAGIMAPFVGIGGQYTGIPMAFIMTFGAIAALLSFYCIVRPAEQADVLHYKKKE